VCWLGFRVSGLGFKGQDSGVTGEDWVSGFLGLGFGVGEFRFIVEGLARV
jgi:hypothetical protein